ncbi:MAG: hypothetical protein KAJ49_04730 [Arcobacteraceae bacterium]|nr:hypothetical protein [Arcobacteraceae bacterium]
MLIKKYRLQSEMENLKVGNEEWFKDYLRQVLESDKESFAKADYIAYSIAQISNKLEYISNEIKLLQDIKKSLTISKEIALRETASILEEYGLEKLEGAAISSLTVTPSKSKVKNTITINDENEVMKMGYVKFMPDLESIEKAMATDEGLKELDDIVSIESTTIDTPAKIKINSRRSVNNTSISTNELLQLKQAS